MKSPSSFERMRKHSRRLRDGAKRKQVELDCCVGRTDRMNEDLVGRTELEVVVVVVVGVVEFGLDRYLLLVSSGN